MGEIAGLVLRKLTREGLLFGGVGGDQIFKSGAFHTKFISEVEGDKVGSYENCREILMEQLGAQDPTEQDCQIVRYVCEIVSRRAAQLVSAGVACLLNKIGEKKAVVAGTYF
jgi:hexokinase